MDKALVSGAKDCGFESHLGWVVTELFLYHVFIFSLPFVGEKKNIATNKKL